MTDSDELLTKADALLARWRSGAVVPRPPVDYPVLTEVVKAPADRDDIPPPEIPSDPAIPVLDASTATTAAETTEAMEVPILDSPEAPPLDAPLAPATTDTVLTALESAEELPNLPSIEDSPAPTVAALQALEERVRLRVLDTIETYVGAFLEEPLRLRIEELARQLAEGIAMEAREDILTLVRDAVRNAVARELESQRDEHPRGPREPAAT